MKYHCPICRRELISSDPDRESFFPFCSKRCKFVDLGKWLTEEYLIPGKEEGENREEPDSERDKKERE